MKAYTEADVETFLETAFRAGFNGGAGRTVNITHPNEEVRALFDAALTRAQKAYTADTIKAGARHSMADLADMQAMHDLTVRQGAVCGAKAWTLPSSIKAVGGGKVEGLLVRYTDPQRLDLGLDYFDASTDLGVKDGQELPILFHHGLDATIGRRVIGRGQVKYTPEGLWLASWLNRRDAYEAMVYKLCEMQKAGYSSGADPDSVVRQPLPSKAGAHRIARWKVIEGSITPIPMDAGNAVSIKSLMASSDPRAARLLRELGDLECDLRIAELDDEIRARKMLAEFDAFERSIR